MKKIMQINITCGKGSTGKLAEALYTESLSNGFEARFAYSAYEPTLKEAFSIETKFQNYLRRGLNKYFGRRQRHSNPGTRRLIRYLKKENPDLIHLHNIQQNAVNYIKLFEFLKNSGIKTVYTLHDCWAFTGGCFHFTKMGCNGYKTDCSLCLLTEHLDDFSFSSKRAYALKSELVGGNDNIYITCVSNWLANEAKKSYMGETKNTPITIYNGISLNVFFPRKSEIRKKLNITEDAFLILSTASFWNNDKGLDVFLELSEKLPPNCVIVLAGSQLEKVKRPNIVTVDRTESQIELAELYSAADVFVNASIEETFGLTTAEALACGTPAIVFNSTACPEIVDEKTGIVIEKDLEQLVEAIETVMANGKLFYSENCVNRAKSMFDEKIMTDKFIGLYRSILNE